MSDEYIKTYLGSLPNKSNNDVLCIDIVLLRESVLYISISLVNVIINPLSRVPLSRNERTPERRLSIRMMATLMTKIIIVQYLC